MHLLVGPSGAGKTREAFELAQALAPVSGAASIYLAKGYVEPTAPLPRQAGIRRVIVLIDDYDFCFPPAGAASFDDRQAGYAEAIANLGKLYRRMKSLVDLHAFIVTINTHRLPVTGSELIQMLPECSCCVLPPLSQAESREFIKAASEALGSRITDEAADVLANASDGRFDIVATFLAGFKTDTVIGKAEVLRYREVRDTIWAIFRSALSEEQRGVYDQAKLLKDFGLPARAGYVAALLHTHGQLRTQREVLNLLKSIWQIRGDEAIIYEGQFGPAQLDERRAIRVTRAVLTMVICGLEIAMDFKVR